jgi:DNA polymerase
VKPGVKESDARTELAAIARSLRELIQGRLGDVQKNRSAQADRNHHPKGTSPARVTVQSRGTGLGGGTTQAQGTSQAKQTAQAENKPNTATLSELRQEVAGCKRCSLHKTRSNVVFGAGRGSTSILFIGEAPGRDEDLQGLPFVGRAGQLLTKIIEAIKFEREDVYIANVLKCRPPENRNPLPDEVDQCRPYLMKQIEILKPKVICTLGVFATQALLDTKSPLTVLRGRVHQVDGFAVVPTYHPAACLRYPRLKAAVWEDVKLLRKEYLS